RLHHWVDGASATSSSAFITPATKSPPVVSACPRSSGSCTTTTRVQAVICGSKSRTQYPAGRPQQPHRGRKTGDEGGSATTRPRTERRHKCNGGNGLTETLARDDTSSARTISPVHSLERVR